MRQGDRALGDKAPVMREIYFSCQTIVSEQSKCSDGGTYVTISPPYPQEWLKD